MMRFPFCRLHATRLVDRLPAGCPLGAPRPADACMCLREAAYLAFGRQAVSDGVALEDRAETCSRCIAALLRHPHIWRLRAAAAEPHPRNPDRPIPSEPVVISRRIPRKRKAVTR